MKLYLKEIKSTLILAVPVIIGQLGHMMMSVVDSLMVGRLGAEPLAAACLVNGLFMLILVIGYGISIGITPLVAMAKGAGKTDECGIILRQGLILNMIVGLVLFMAAVFFAEAIRFLEQPEEIVSMAVTFMKILGWSIIPVMFFQTYRQFTEGLAIMVPAMIIMLVANLFNVFANWIFIFGHLGVPAMGLKGAGFATFSSRMFMALSMMGYVMLAKKMKPFDPNLRFRKIDGKTIKKILKIGLPAGFQYFFEVSAFSGSAIIIGWMGTMELAAHQIALNLASITFMFALGISSAASVRVATAAGTGNIRSTRMAGFSALFLGTGIMGCFAVLFILLRYFLPTLYISNQEVIQLTAPLLVIAAVFQISDGIQVIGLGALRGIADMKIPTLMTFLAYWVICLPLGYMLGFKFGFGLNGIWLGFVAGLAIVAFMATVRFNYRSKVKVSI